MTVNGVFNGTEHGVQFLLFLVFGFGETSPENVGIFQKENQNIFWNILMLRGHQNKDPEFVSDSIFSIFA